MNATKLRYVLGGIIGLLVIIIIAGIWFLQSFLNQQVLTTDHAKIDADISQQEALKLRKLQTEMAGMKDIIARTKQIAATTEQYGFQDQVISDLSTYAGRNGIRINSFDFSQTAPGSKPGTAPSGKTTFLVSLRSPVKYESFLKFVRDIEQNLTKIQVTSLTLSPDPKDTSLIQNPTLGLEVFLKK